MLVVRGCRHDRRGCCVTTPKWTSKKQYVDTHGQSEVGFAFCYLLGFALLPRLKNLKKQRLYRPRRENRKNTPTSSRA